MAKRKSLSRHAHLRRELEQIRGLAFSAPEGTSHKNTVYLEIERGALIRARILLDCAILEELWALMIMNYTLTDSPKWNERKYFGRVKRYVLFYQEILGRLPAHQKMVVVKKVARVPKSIAKIAERMLALRNILSHVYTVDYTNKRALQYNGHSILTLPGFESYVEDSSRVVSYFIEAANVL